MEGGKMKSKTFTAVIVMLVLAPFSTIIPGCACPSEAADSYMAIVPKVLHSGGTETLSMSLFSEGRPVRDRVEIALLSEGEEIYKIQEEINGKGTVEIDIPEVEDGEYEIQVSGTGFRDEATIAVEKSFLVFIETDKPIYTGID